MPQTERSQKWDITKFALIFLVVLGHAAEYILKSSEFMRSLFLFIYTFHMPLFIFISGLFSKNTINQKRFDRMFGYLILHFILKLFPFCYRSLMGESVGINWWYESGIPWFMLALFAFNLITFFIRKLPKVLVMTAVVVLGCSAGYFSLIGDFLAVSRVVVFYPFFYLGYCIDRQKLESFCNVEKFKILSVVILIVFAVVVFCGGDRLYWLRPLLTGRNPFSTLGVFSDAGFLIRLAYYAVSVVVSTSIVVLVPEKTPFGISARLGQRTLAVYGFHYVLLYFVFEKHIPNLSGFGNWIIFPVSLIVTLFFSVRFFNNFMLFVLDIPHNITKALKNIE